MEILNNVSLKTLNTFKIGGNAQWLACPNSLADWQWVLRQRAEVPITLLGKGSNVLIRDQGIEGLVLYLGKMENQLVWLDECTVRVNAGVRLSYLVFQSLRRGLNVVFLSGIPGTVGGALTMNAGAMGDSFWNYVEEVKLITRAGKIIPYEITNLKIGYREVIGLPENTWFAEAILRFPLGEKEDLKKLQAAWMCKRRTSQPLNYPNAGSIFRNPAGNYAAYLIEKAGLKGLCYGKAQVSIKHANFIVNRGGALAKEVEQLIAIVQNRVAEQFNVQLFPEIKILGI